jgi:hypothetical protein
MKNRPLLTAIISNEPIILQCGFYFPKNIGMIYARFITNRNEFNENYKIY